MSKKLKLLIISFCLFIFPINSVFAEDKVKIDLFWSIGCPHCEHEKIFLMDLLEDENYKNKISVNEYEISRNTDNSYLLREMADNIDVQVKGVPATFINGEVFISGFLNAEVTGLEIKKNIDKYYNNEINTPSDNEFSENVDIPFLGNVNLKSFSLPIITIVLGVIDGFNPCAMWVLLFLITMLLGMENKKRMWILGFTFIFSSAFVYFLFMSAWLNLILFLGFIIWVRILIGGIALTGGTLNIKEFFKNKDGGCKVTNKGERKKVFEKIKIIINKKSFLLSLLGIIILAFAVNLVELICSAGLPAIYAQVLAISNVSGISRYFYILLYIFFFMIDDLIIFTIAMITLKMTGISTKYSRWSSLVGGILMFIIGILLIFKPEWLMFG